MLSTTTRPSLSFTKSIRGKRRCDHRAVAGSPRCRRLRLEPLEDRRLLSVMFREPELLKDIKPGAEEPFLNHFTEAGDIMFFQAYDGVHGKEPWKTDGTPQGTELVRDIRPGTAGSIYHPLVDFNGVLFFKANDGEHGKELWRSDGTEAGTYMVKDIYPGFDDDGHPFSSEPTLGVVFKENLFFRAYNADYGGQLWKTDGTEVGTVPATEFPVGFGVYSMVSAGETLYGIARGGDLWATDGTAEGLQLVHEFPDASSRPLELTVVADTLFFTADDGVNGRELWRSYWDETASQWSAEMVVDVDISPGHRPPQSLTNVNGTLYFTADNGVDGRELWACHWDEASNQ